LDYEKECYSTRHAFDRYIVLHKANLRQQWYKKNSFLCEA
jgi:hypothetical protein